MPTGYLFGISFVPVTSGPNRRALLTAASLGELNKAQGRVVGRDRLKSNVAVPLCSRLLLGAQLFALQRLAVDLLVLHRADCADLRVCPTQFPLRIEDRVDVEPGVGGSAGEFSQSED